MTQTVYLTLAGKISEGAATAVSGDKDARILRCVIKDYVPAEGDFVTLRATKPDDTVLYLTAVYKGGAAEVTLNDQVLAVSGDVRCDLSIVNGSKILSTDEFVLSVRPASASGTAVESANEFKALQDLFAAIGALETVSETEISQLWEA
jgi:hypothetical protein